MITFASEKMTPKQAAQALLNDAIRCKLEFYFEDTLLNHDKMTDKDRVKLKAQMILIANRMNKYLGVNE